MKSNVYSLKCGGGHTEAVDNWLKTLDAFKEAGVSLVFLNKEQKMVDKMYDIMGTGIPLNLIFDDGSTNGVDATTPNKMTVISETYGEFFFINYNGM